MLRPSLLCATQFDGSPDDEELITNDDEWLWGEHKKKVRDIARAPPRLPAAARRGSRAVLPAARCALDPPLLSPPAWPTAFAGRQMMWQRDVWWLTV